MPLDQSATHAVSIPLHRLRRQPSQPATPSGSRSGETAEISKSGWGGPRENAGGPRPHAGRPRKTPLPDIHLGIRWFVVATYPQAERYAVAELARQGYVTYLPLLAVRRRDRVTPTMIHIVEVPLFPSYAFVRFDRDRDPWTPINHTRGVSGVITQGSKPTPCEIGAVEALREGEELRRSLSPPGAPYRPGEACEAVLGGGLKVQGVVKSLTADGNGVIMSAMMFGGLRTIRVDISKLRLRNEGRTIN